MNIARLEEANNLLTAGRDIRRDSDSGQSAGKEASWLAHLPPLSHPGSGYSPS
jgi:hypothetical protein